MFISGAQAASAATLYFSPSSGVYDTGKTFSVGVYVSSPNETMNAASGVISFPPDKLEVVSLSKTGSIFSLWVQEPSFSNSGGAVNFEGVVLNPGFRGASGKMITVNFRTKTAGSANLAFVSGEVLANDGQGTNILSGLGTASFSVGGALPSAPESVSPPEVISSGAPPAPIITSPTHPDPNQWYANPAPLLNWNVPAGVNAVRLLLNKTPRATPSVPYSPAISSRQIDNLEDGVWYFHAQFRNSAGWGSIANYRLQIDTQPPRPFRIAFPEGKETDNPRPPVIFGTTDALSGIDHYRIKIGESEPFDLGEDVQNKPYPLPLQAPGKRTLLIQAFDRAGNSTVAAEEFTVTPLEPPVITDYPRELNQGDALVIRGKTYPDAAVKITLRRDDEGETEYEEAKSDAAGTFTLVWGRELNGGVYKFRAEATDSRGARSLPTPEYTFSVKPEPWLGFGYLAFNYLAIIIALIVMVVSLLFAAWYLWLRFKSFRRRLRKEVGEVEHAIRHAFDFLRKSVREEVRILEKARSRRELTKEEERIAGQLKKTLDEMEKFLKEEVEDIEDIERKF